MDKSFINSKSKAPKFRGRWRDSIRSTNGGHSQCVAEVVPDLGFSTKSIARRREASREVTGPRVFHDPVPTPAPASPPAPAPQVESSAPPADPKAAE